MKIATIILIGCSTYVAGCNSQKAIESMIPAKESEFAKLAFDFAQHNLPNEIFNLLPSESHVNEAQASLVEMCNVLPNSPADSIRLIDYHKTVVNGEMQAVIESEFYYPNKWFLGVITIKQQNGEYKASGIRILPLSIPMEISNSFKFNYISVERVIILFMIAAIPVFILITATKCAFEPKLKRKWIWLAFIFVCLGQFRVNWADSSFGIYPIVVNLLGISVYRTGCYGPWILSSGFPIGAILYWVKSMRKKSLANNALPL